MYYQSNTYNHKTILLNKYIEEYLYSTTIQRKKIKKHSYPLLRTSKIDYNLINRKNLLRRLLLCNEDLNKFITLTFADQSFKSVKKANYEFKKFVLRLLYKNNSLKYIAVPEKTKKGVIHYHLVTNLPYIKKSELQTIWQNGFVQINHIYNNQIISLYISKYISKDKSLPKGSKHLFRSKNLNLPIIDFDIDAEITLRNLDYTIIQTKEFNNKYLGQITYNFIKLN